MDQTLILGMFASGFFLCVIVAYIVSQTSKKGGSSQTRIGDGRALPDPEWKKGGAPWNISWAGNPENVSTTKQGVRITYKKGKYASDSGAQMRANPFNSLPADRATLSYQIYIPNDFPWGKVGKLGPGFCVGLQSGQCSTGGNWQNDSGSLRVTWDGRTKGAQPYVYIPLQVGDGSVKKAVAAQSAEFQKESQVTAAGVHIYHKNPLPIEAGKWNAVQIQLSLNTPGKNNGSVTIAVNGKTKTMSNMLWRMSSKMRITDVLFSSFFGGGDASFAASRDTYMIFRNFTFAAG